MHGNGEERRLKSISFCSIVRTAARKSREVMRYNFLPESADTMLCQFAPIKPPACAHRPSLSPQSLSQLTSTVQNQIPHATEPRILIGFTHQRGFKSCDWSLVAGGGDLNSPGSRRRPRLHAKAAQRTETAARPHWEAAGMCKRTWSGGNLGPRGDGINISTSAIVVMLLHWQISVSLREQASLGGGNGKVKDMQGKTLAV